MDVRETSGGKVRTGHIVAGTTIVLTAGMGTVVVGIVRDNPTRAAGGACLTICALTLVALMILHQWITDTSTERSRLADATKAARDERTRYVASLAALDAERVRVRRDAGLEASHLQAQLTAERETMRTHFEAERHKVVCQAFEMGALLERSGMLSQSSTNAQVRLLFPTRPSVDSGIRHPS